MMVKVVMVVIETVVTYPLEVNGVTGGEQNPFILKLAATLDCKQNISLHDSTTITCVYEWARVVIYLISHSPQCDIKCPHGMVIAL